MSTLKTELGSKLVGFGVFLIVIAGVLAFFTFRSVIGEEIKYAVSKTVNEKKQETIVPVNPNFSIMIPKLGANAPVISNVDPYNESEYQLQLTKGVAHARGSSLPNQKGTVFLFAHSAQDFYKASEYNAVFYLLYKLQAGDSITLYFDKKPVNYLVRELSYVEESEIKYLTENTADDRLILMTCWPPGTTLKRLLVIAEPSR